MKALTIMVLSGLALFLTTCATVKEQRKFLSQLKSRAQEMKVYAKQKGYSTRYCFLIDMRRQSGLKRFFVYDLVKDSVAFSGLVAHGSCDQDFIPEPKYSNDRGSGCTSVGVYKVGHAYKGQYGKAYKLHGLQSTNSNAFERAVVLHGYDCVPEDESFPKPICNSMGCPMVSFPFLKKLSAIIDKSNKPVLLWVYDVKVKEPGLLG